MPTQAGESVKSQLPHSVDLDAVAAEPRGQSKAARWERLSVNLAPEVAEALRDLARRRRVSVTEVVRQAISDEKYLQDAADDGAKILIQEEGRPLRELIFRRSL